MRDIILKNRYTLLSTVLLVYVMVVVIEGAITGREARVIEFDNSFIEVNLNNLEELGARRNEGNRRD